MGVTSLIDLTSIPAACRARIADSRPAPGPLTITSTDRRPTFLALLPAAGAAPWAANGVPCAAPLKPIRPADDQETMLPSGSEIEMMVLLNVAWMCAIPCGTTRRSFFLAPLRSFLPSALAIWLWLPLPSQCTASGAIIDASERRCDVALEAYSKRLSDRPPHPLDPLPTPPGGKGTPPPSHP